MKEGKTIAFTAHFNLRSSLFICGKIHFLLYGTHYSTRFQGGFRYSGFAALPPEADFLFFIS